MAESYFDNLDGNARVELANLFAMVHEAISGGVYPDGLDGELAGFCTMDAESRAKALDGIRNPAQASLDKVLDILTDEQAETVPDVFPAWVPNTDYKAGDRRRYSDGYLYKCVQDHKSQEDWTPDKTPALWTRIGEPGKIPVWVQPTGAQDAYNTGDKVHFPTIEDPVYESTIDGNVWSPVVYGWTEAS